LPSVATTVVPEFKVSIMIPNTSISIGISTTVEVSRRKSIPLRHYIDNKKLYFVCKRLFDVAVSIIFIICILSWMLPVLAVLIRLNSRGPVFFKQRRVGRGGRSFTCYKFRTMVVNKLADIQQAKANDERVTRIGKYLRRSNIDEFPQVFNVLLGSMSIVGPRPHMYADCLRFSSIVPGYKLRNFVKPGITGLSQVKGYHGRVTSYECIFKRYQWDVFYVRNCNFLLDLSIVTKTALQRFLYIFGL
jgi:putative colanic acid biosynthesis UDP-glucose lipid carrier transferase